MSHILLGFINKELCRKIDDGPFYFQSELVRIFCVDCFVETQWKRSMICDYITASPWWNVILCKVLECHRSTSLPWKGLSHTSPWISTQSIQYEVVCQYIILTSSLPLSAGDHNHSKYLVSVHEMYLGCVCHFPTDLAWATACYTKDVVYKFLCLCI